MNQPTPAIRITNLTKIYDKRAIINDLSLEVRKGEIFALLGHNGAGKTTLINILSTLIAPDHGEAFLLGNSIQTDATAIKNLIGISPQETSIAEHLTCFENIMLIAQIYGQPRLSAQQKTNELLHALDLEAYAHTLSAKLSGGLQRRLSIAMALVSEPKILFLDEPTIGLDPQSRRKLWEFIRKLGGEKTVILTTHYLDEADELADRIAIIKAGKLVALGTSEELKSQLIENDQASLITSPLSEACIAKLRTLYNEVSHHDTRLEIHHGHIDFEELVGVLHDCGVKIEWFSMKARSLEEVFLSFLDKEGDA